MRRDGTAMSTAQPVPPPLHDADADRERAERDLRETLSLLNATFEATADGILVVDLAGHILSFNRKFAELWRIPDSILETDRKSTRLNSSHSQISYAVFCLKKPSYVRTEMTARLEAEGRIDSKAIAGRTPQGQ